MRGTLAALLVLVMLASAWPVAAPLDDLEPAGSVASDSGGRQAPAVPLRWTNVSGETGLWSWNGDFFSWADYDEDGDQDLLVNGARLLENGGGPNWTFTDVTAARNISGGGSTGVWGDLNGDGHLDLYLGGRTSDGVLLSDGPSGNWSFSRDETRTAIVANSDPTTVGTFRDVNNDGLLDLYVGGGEDWNDGDAEYYPDHLFFGSAAAPYFIDRTDMLNPDNYYARGVSWGDGDRDGWSDLYVGNYRIVPNRYYSNDEGTLNVQLGHTSEGSIRTYSGNDYWGHTIASAWGDLTGDGFPEVVSANLVHLYWDTDSTNAYPDDIRGLICDDSHIYSHDPVNDVDWFDHRPDSNISFRPRGGAGVYTGDELYAGVAMGDVDLDGDLDLWLPQVYDLDYARAEMWINDGTGVFTDRAGDWGIDVIGTYGGTFVDFDGDGDLDLLTGGSDEVGQTNRIHLYRNELIEDGGSAPVVATVEDVNGATAYGASIEAWSNSTFLGREEVRGGEGPHGSMSDSRVRFPADPPAGARWQTDGSIDLLTMWPTGEAQWSRNLTSATTISLAPTSSAADDYGFAVADATRSTPYGEDELFAVDIAAPAGSTVEVDMGLDGIIDWSTTDFQPADSPVSLSFPNSGRRVARMLAYRTDAADDAVQTGRWLTFAAEVANSAPTAHLNHSALLPGIEVTFDATGSDDSAFDRARLEYRWSFDDGPYRNWDTNATFNRSFDAPGLYDLTLRVRDEAGETDRLDIVLNVTTPSPSATLALPASVAMDSVVNPVVEVVVLGYPNETYEFHYDWGDGAIRDWYQTSAAFHWWTEPGPVVITLTIRDGFGMQTILTHPLTVLNPAPVVIWWAAATSVEEGDTAGFQVTASDTASHDDSLTFAWFLDGSLLTGQTAASLHLPSPGLGDHTVSVSVTDAAGGVTTLTTTLQVTPSDGAGDPTEYAATLLLIDAIAVGDDIWYSDASEVAWQTTPASGWTVLSNSAMAADSSAYQIELLHTDSGETVTLAGVQQQVRLVPWQGVDATMASACDPVGWHADGVPAGAVVLTTMRTPFGDVTGELPVSAPFEAQTVETRIILTDQEMIFTTVIPAGGPVDAASPGAACERTEDANGWRLTDGWLGSLEGDFDQTGGGNGGGGDSSTGPEGSAEEPFFGSVSLLTLMIGGSAGLLVLIGTAISIALYLRRRE